MRLVIIVDIDNKDFAKDDYGAITDETFELNRTNVERVVLPVLVEEYGSPYVKIEVVGEHDYDEDTLGQLFD